MGYAILWDGNSYYQCPAGPFKIGPVGCPEMSVANNTRCVTSHKTEDLTVRIAHKISVHKCQLKKKDPAGKLRIERAIFF